MSRFNNVQDAIRDITDDPELVCHASSVVCALIILRHKRGLTVTDIAKKAGYTVDCIEYLESGYDCELKWEHVVAYCRALDIDVTMLLVDQLEKL